MSAQDFHALDQAHRNYELVIGHPSALLLSSHPAKWQGIHLEFYRHPPVETPPQILEQYVLSIPTRHITKVEEIIEGKVKSAPFAVGDISIATLGLPYQYRWEEEIEVIHLILEPDLVKSVAQESVNPDRVELSPHFIQSDRLIYQVGIALCNELETSGCDSKLYAESASTFLSAHLLSHYSAQDLSIYSYDEGLPRQKLKEAIDYIDAYLAVDLSLEIDGKPFGPQPLLFQPTF